MGIRKLLSEIAEETAVLRQRAPGHLDRQVDRSQDPLQRICLFSRSSPQHGLVTDVAAQDPLLGELLKMRAGLAQLDAAEPRRTDGELATDQVVQRHAARDEVAPALARRDGDAVVAL